MPHSKTFDIRFWKIFIPFLFVFILILFLPAMITNWYWFELDFSDTGSIGDTIGGIMGPFIAIAAAILTFLAFWVQFIANEQQRRDIRLERFENRYYELLQLHKSNVNEMNIANKLTGRKCFVQMFYELRFIYKQAEFLRNNTDERIAQENDYENIDLMNLSYRIFFFGIGQNSEKQFTHSFSNGEKHLFGRIKKELVEIQKDAESYFDKPSEKGRIYTHKPSQRYKKLPEEIDFYYYPFDGHVNRLGHYYRHLFQTVKYITSQEIINESEKYIYLKTLRAQLSNFEQLHLYYNALAWFDKEWKEIFTTFRFIKNLPLTLADFHISPEEKFKTEIKNLKEKNISMFEWLE